MVSCRLDCLWLDLLDGFRPFSLRRLGRLVFCEESAAIASNAALDIRPVHARPRVQEEDGDEDRSRACQGEDADRNLSDDLDGPIHLSCERATCPAREPRTDHVGVRLLVCHGRQFVLRSEILEQLVDTFLV